jgi:hypothetical protein
VAQLAAGTLTGGSWVVNANSNLNFASGSSITSLSGAKVTLSGANSNFTALANLAMIGSKSSFIMSSGRNFTIVGSFTNNGSLTIGAGSSMAATSGFTQVSTGTLALQIGGTAANPTFGNIAVGSSGTVALAGVLKVTSSVAPAVGTAFMILNNQSTGSISGFFTGLPEGTTFTVKSGSTTMTFKITYVGESGNDVVITRIS